MEADSGRDQGWEWPDPPPHDPAAAPILSTGDFEGPLDWLVEQARSRRIDLRRLSVLTLVETFEAALQGALDGQASARTILQWGDWLVLAAELTLLRSRLMLPAAESAAARDEAEALRRRLIGRAEMAAAAAWLGRRPQLGLDTFERGAPEIPRHGGRGRTGDITALLRACLVVLAVPEDTDTAFRVATPLWTVADAVAALRRWRDEGTESEANLERFLPLLSREQPGWATRRRAAMASLFVGGLQLTRDGVLTLTQAHAMGPIGVRPASHASLPS